MHYRTCSEEGGCGNVALSESQSCNLQDCLLWSAWGEWSECSTTCGPGVRTHARTCINGDPGMAGCVGASFEEGECSGSVSCFGILVIKR